MFPYQSHKKENHLTRDAEGQRVSGINPHPQFQKRPWITVFTTKGVCCHQAEQLNTKGTDQRSNQEIIHRRHPQVTVKRTISRKETRKNRQYSQNLLNTQELNCHLKYDHKGKLFNTLLARLRSLFFCGTKSRNSEVTVTLLTYQQMISTAVPKSCYPTDDLKRTDNL